MDEDVWERLDLDTTAEAGARADYDSQPEPLATSSIAISVTAMSLAKESHPKTYHQAS